MNEKLIIENFAGIKYLEINLSKINIFIGQQTTGKSICAKLLFFFKRFDNELINAVENDLTKKEFDKLLLSKFIEYFPIHSYPDDPFSINYLVSSCNILIIKDKEKKLEIQYSDIFYKTFTSYKKYFSKLKNKNLDQDSFEIFKPTVEIRNKYHKEIKELIGDYSGYNQIYIPAGRSFFANLQKSIFSFLSSNKAIDPFILEFGSFYEQIKQLLQRSLLKDKFAEAFIEKILLGVYLQDKGNDYIMHQDGRKINIAYSSSGQQETLPLVLILKTLINIKFSSNGAVIYIEEPEAHIFPNAQKLIVEFISYVFNHSKTKYQFIITTHSPYILTAFNNLLQAGIIENEGNRDKNNELYKTIQKELILKPDSINAYSLQKDNYCNLMNQETGLISANILDEVSNEISDEFDKLLNIM